MTTQQALSLHNGDEVKVISTGDITTVLTAYRDDDGIVCIETDYNGYTVFYPDEIS